MNKSFSLLILILSVAGGFAGSFLFQQTHRENARNLATSSASEITARRIRLLDESGKTRAELTLGQGGSPALFFYDSHGRNRLVLGLYPPAENEYPLVVLNDTQGRAAEILRLFGDKETPVLVQKAGGQDRTVMGLNPGNTEPFLVYYPSSSGKKSVFGNF